MMPYSEKMYLDIEVESSNRNDMRKAESAVTSIQALLDQEEEVQKYISAVGGRVFYLSMISAHCQQLIGLHKGNIVAKVNFSNSERFKSKGEYKKYLEQLIKEKIPGVRVLIKELDVKPSGSEKVQLRIVGKDYEVLNQVAEIMKSLIKFQEVRMYMLQFNVRVITTL